MSQKCWDERYDTAELIHGSRPSDFLLENARLLPGRGLALDIAAGEGRNAVFLAELGYEAVALDISFRALYKCKRLASDRSVVVHAAAVDLSQFVIPMDRFDVIINFNYLQRDLAPQIAAGLRSGGILLFETLTVDHLRWKPDFNPEYLLRRGELVDLFRDLRLLKYREADLHSDKGTRSVASIAASKE